MTDPVARTFDHLAASANEFALPVLLRALDVADEQIREHAVTAIVRRGQKRGFAELIRRYDALPVGLREKVDAAAFRMPDPLREAIAKEKAEVRRNAIRIVENATLWSHVETMSKLVIENDESASEAMRTVQILVDRLFDELAKTGEGNEDSVSRRQTRQNVLAALVAAAGRSTATPFLDDLITCALILAKPEDAPLRTLLADGDSAIVRSTWKLLEASRHRGVMGLLASLLTHRIAADRLIAILESRDDPEFVLQLLRSLPERFPDLLRGNLRRITKLPWIDRELVEFDWIPPGLQGRLVALVSATDVDRDLILDVQQWVVRHAGVVGRIAAVEALAATDHAAMEHAIADGLTSDDEEVQAWATSQLREHNIPQAFSLLIERLDSPMEPVRAAAREELESFDLYRMLDLYEHLKPHVCRRAGELIRKIHPDTLERLESELRSPLRSKRIRAIHGARALGWHGDVAPVLLELLHDDDHTIQRAAMETLADLPLPEVRQELERLQTDDSPRIRQAAAAALRGRGLRVEG